MKFGREVMQMLLDGKRVASDGLMSDDGYLALDAEGLLKYYYCDHGTRRAVQYGMNGYYERPVDSKEQTNKAGPDIEYISCKL